MDIYTIPYHDKYIVYRPLKRLAFIANAALLNSLVKAQRDPPRSPHPEPDPQVAAFLDAIGFWEPDSSPPLSATDNIFKPTIAVLFLTTACNFRGIAGPATIGTTSIVRN